MVYSLYQYHNCFAKALSKAAVSGFESNLAKVSISLDSLEVSFSFSNFSS